jgi:hypothetical protein
MLKNMARTCHQRALLGGMLSAFHESLGHDAPVCNAVAYS